MAGRTNKSGLDYFPLDVNFFQDDKIEFVTARFDEKGELATIKLLCLIYKNGYYYEWNDDTALLFAKRVGRNFAHSFVKDVVHELVKRGFFDRSIFDSFGVLTSKGIQRRFLQAVYERKEVEIISDYWLIEAPESTKKTTFLINPPINSINPPINSEKPPINEQSKVKYSKVKKSKEENTYSLAIIENNKKENMCMDFLNWNKWIAEKTPFCANPKNLKQLSEMEFLVLKEKYGSEKLADTIRQLENRKDKRKNYSNLYRTLDNWAKNTVNT